MASEADNVQHRARRRLPLRGQKTGGGGNSEDSYFSTMSPNT